MKIVSHIISTVLLLVGLNGYSQTDSVVLRTFCSGEEVTVKYSNYDVETDSTWCNGFPEDGTKYKCIPQHFINFGKSRRSNITAYLSLCDSFGYDLLFHSYETVDSCIQLTDSIYVVKFKLRDSNRKRKSVNYYHFIKYYQGSRLVLYISQKDDKMYEKVKEYALNFLNTAYW